MDAGARSADVSVHRTGGGQRATKYLAWGWWQIRALVVCSGNHPQWFQLWIPLLTGLLLWSSRGRLSAVWRRVHERGAARSFWQRGNPVVLVFGCAMLLLAHLVQIKGVAFGGINAVRGVEVSIDDGKTWQAAKFVGPDLGRYAWRLFVLPVKLAAVTYTVACRATDSIGNRHPEERMENAAGYNNTSWRDHAMQITVV